MNGQRADANYFSVDGASANFGVTSFAPLMQSAADALPALNAFAGTNSLVSLDAIQEFPVQNSSLAHCFWLFVNHRVHFDSANPLKGIASVSVLRLRARPGDRPAATPTATPTAVSISRKIG